MTTRRLISAGRRESPDDELNFEQLSSADEIAGSQDSPTLSVLGRITGDGVAFRSREVRDDDVQAITIDTEDGTGPGPGAEIRVTDASGDNILTQTLPTEVVATPLDGETRVVENVLVGEIPYPPETSEVEIRTAPPDESERTVTTRVDATASVVAELSVLDQPVRVDESATFDAAPSFAASSDASIQEYEWTIDGEPTGQGETLEYTFRSGGAHEIALTITDSTGAQATTSQTISPDSESDSNTDISVTRTIDSTLVTSDITSTVTVTVEATFGADIENASLVDTIDGEGISAEEISLTDESGGLGFVTSDPQPAVDLTWNEGLDSGLGSDSVRIEYELTIPAETPEGTIRFDRTVTNGRTGDTAVIDGDTQLGVVPVPTTETVTVGGVEVPVEFTTPVGGERTVTTDNAVEAINTFIEGDVSADVAVNVINAFIAS